ncbi:hypothetical protein ABH19_06130 [Leptospirillum sp. Group II 'CF-1']|uniref:Uncharacterized protein n=1 Tax=Leptospirillum ferriphilum (strain ML-04) TaxID=1048260 RepID=J9ZD32_LEPFM|nr:hypothetical protein LFML04_1404 [Leptospirillum ferriphilum ML-04]AKS23417.1 hypothetical protein ABH19_06130 [Leptospirillum sp. Group II 'CF-1']
MPLDIFPDIQKKPRLLTILPCILENRTHGFWTREKVFLGYVSRGKGILFVESSRLFNGPMKRYGILLRE